MAAGPWGCSKARAVQVETGPKLSKGHQAGTEGEANFPTWAVSLA